VHHGVNVDEPKAPHQWHAGHVPQPVLAAPPPQPLPQYINNSAAVMAHDMAAQAARDALFVMATTAMNQRNAALLTVLNRPPAV
jgi:hypothetical protein